MSTITTILATDSPSSSIGDINTNFSNLNADKIEDDSVDTLTNKSIDCDNNTVTNVKPANAPAANKTGLDTKFVTGNDGSTDELGKWNADGDMVAAGVSVTTTQPSSSSDDTTIPTSKAVYDRINTITSQELFFYPAREDTSTNNVFDTTVGDFAATTLASTNQVHFNFFIPDNFVSLTQLSVVIIADATETVQYDLTSDYGGNDEAYNNHSESATNETESVTASRLTELDVSSVFNLLNGGDYCGLTFASDTDSLRVIGLRLKYAV